MAHYCVKCFNEMLSFPSHHLISISLQIFVEFTNQLECQKAQSALAGRKFASRVVVTSFFDVDKFAARDFTVA